jgi:hypothetical protein
MPTTKLPLRLSVKELTTAAMQLSPAELHEFNQWLIEWQRQNGGANAEEATLIQLTKTRLPHAEERRLKHLIAKSERGTLTSKELLEYRALASQAQQLDVRRLEALTELARRRGQSLEAVMQSIGWENGQDEAPSGGTRRAQTSAQPRR